MRFDPDACANAETAPIAAADWGEPIRRPPLWRGLVERGIEFRQAGSVLGCSGEFVRLICLPYSDRRRVRPGPEIAQRIEAWTGGEIVPASFDAPQAPDVIRRPS